MYILFFFFVSITVSTLDDTLLYYYYFPLRSRCLTKNQVKLHLKIRHKICAKIKHEPKNCRSNECQSGETFENLCNLLIYESKLVSSIWPRWGEGWGGRSPPIIKKMKKLCGSDRMSDRGHKYFALFMGDALVFYNICHWITNFEVINVSLQCHLASFLV